MKNIKKSLMVTVASTALVTAQNSHAMLSIALRKFTPKTFKTFTVKPSNTLRLPRLNLSSNPVGDSKKEFAVPGAQVSSSAWKTYTNNVWKKLTGNQKAANDLETRGAAGKSKNGSQSADQDSHGLSSFAKNKLDQVNNSILAALALVAGAAYCENQDEQQEQASSSDTSIFNATPLSPEDNIIPYHYDDKDSKDEKNTEWRCTKILKGQADTYIDAIEFSSDGKSIISGTAWNIKKWETDSGKCIDMLVGSNGYMRTLALSPDGKTFISSGVDGDLDICLLNGEYCIKSAIKHNDLVTAISFSSDGSRAVSGSRDGTVYMWSPETGNCTKKLSDDYTGYNYDVTDVTFSQNRQYVASSSANGKVYISEAETGKCIQTIQDKWSVNKISLSPNGEYLVTSTRTNLKLWETKTGEWVQVYENYGGHLSGLSFSPDGKYIVGATGTDIKIWKTGTGQCIQTIKTVGTNTAKFSPDGNYIVSTSNQNNIKLWERVSNKNWHAFITEQLSELLWSTK